METLQAYCQNNVAGITFSISAFISQHLLENKLDFLHLLALQLLRLHQILTFGVAANEDILCSLFLLAKTHVPCSSAALISSNPTISTFFLISLAIIHWEFMSILGS